MNIENKNQSGPAREIKIIPGWAWTLALVAFVAVQIFFNVFLLHFGHAPGRGPSALLRATLGLAVGLGLGAYLLLLGYVNRDSKRRGMSPVLWTLVALLIPNAIGFLLYFVLRQPIRRACPQCGNSVQTEFNFCPRCSGKLNPSCPRCGRFVRPEDTYCPYCGSSVSDREPEPAGSGSGA